MAQLKSTIIQGSLRVTDTTYTTDLQASSLSTDVLNIINGGSNAAPIDKGINFYNADSSLRAHIGCSDSLALYSSNQIVLRPGAAENSSGEGIALSKTQLLPKNNTIDLGGTSNYWKTAYLSDIYLSSATASQFVKTDANKKLVTATLAAADIPTISITDKTSGTLTIARGGTGATSFTDNCVIVQSGTALESRGLRVAGATNADVTIEPYTNAKTLTVSSKSTLYIQSAASKSLIFKVGTTEYGRFNLNGMFNLNATCTQNTHKLLVNGDSAFTGKLAFTNSADTLSVYGYIDYNTSKRFIFHEQSMSGTSVTSYYENYQLPAPNSARTDNATYDILTSKAAVTVAQGGTGATSFTANSVIMSGASTTAALTTRAVFNMTNKGHLSWTAAATDIHLVTKNTLAYWDGRFKDGKSNLTYCVKGEFGDSVVGNGRVFYGTCSTAAGTAAKEVTCAKYDALTAGDMIIVDFSNTNSAAVANLTLNVNSKGAKPIKKQYNGTLSDLNTVGELHQDTFSVFVYTGEYWIFTNGNYNTNTTPYGIRIYNQTSGYNADYPLIVSRTPLTTQIGTNNENGSYTNNVYGVIWDSPNDGTHNKTPTLNPSTGRMKIYDLTMVNKAISLQNGNSTSHLVTISAANNTATADHTWYIPNLNQDRYFVTRNTASSLGGVTQPVYISNNAAVSVCTNTLDLVYPVGSIYISTVADNPNPDNRADAIFPNTTWVAFGQGQVLVGVNSSDTDFNISEKTGGEKTHTLTDTEMPKHQHTIPSMTTKGTTVKARYANTNTTLYDGTQGYLSISYNGYNGAANSGGSLAYISGSSHTHTIDSGYVTGFTPTNDASAHNNMPPYITVYMWKRTA